jgi:hypothetical protein
MTFLQQLRRKTLDVIKNLKSGGDDDEFERRLQAGQDVLARYEKDRHPFILFLRTFDIQFFLGNPAYPGDPNGVYPLRDRINRTLKKGVGLVAIAQSGEFPSMRSVKASSAPLLRLRDENWELVVAHLIGAASIIVTEVVDFSWGVTREFEMIRHHRKEGETVVILPSPDMPFDLSELCATLSTFTRIVRASELPPTHPLRSFVFADLLARTYEIARASSYERLAADLNGEWQRRFPVTFNGVVQGYDELGRFYLKQGVLGLANARFQRALMVASAHRNFQAMAQQYVNLARVMFAAGDREKSRSLLEQARDAFGEVGSKFDVDAMERELTFAFVKHVMRRYPYGPPSS